MIIRSVSRSARRAAARALLLPLALGAAACTSSLVPPRQGIAMRDVSYPMRDMRFPSGLRVIAEKDDRMPLVGLFLVVGAGASSDPPGKEGLAHYVEHLAFRSRPFGESSFRRLLERAGAGQWNAFTGLDDTVYYEVGPSSALPDLLRLEGARMRAPVSRIAPDTLHVELDVVQNELRQRGETGIAGEVMSSVQAALFPAGHPYARPVIGTHETLSAITPDDVEAFVRAQYRPDNMTLLVLGDVDLQGIGTLVEQVLPPALLARTGAPAPASPRIPARAPAPPDPPPGGLVKKEAAVATPEIWIGWSLPRAFDTDAYLAEITRRTASGVLAGAEHEDEDIAFVTTELVQGKEASILLCRAALQHGAHPERSLDHVLGRLHRVWSGARGATAVQLDEAVFDERRRAAVVGMLLESEDLLERGVERATITHFAGDPALFSRALRSVDQLTPTRVFAFAHDYLTRERARAVLFTPPTGGSAPSSSAGVGVKGQDDEPLGPIHVDAVRLGAVAPAPGVKGYATFSLPNGMEVIVGRRPGLPVVSIGLLLRGGGIGDADDPAAARAALMLDYPREKWHGDPELFGTSLSERGTLDEVSYRITGASGNAAIMLAIVAERVRSMAIDSGDWDPFQRDRVPYLRLAEQKPEIVANRELMATLLGDHPYGRSATADGLGKTSLTAARGWIDTTHVPERAVLVVVGDLEPQEIEAVVREQFGSWSGGKDSWAPPAPRRLSAGAPAAPQLIVTARPGATQAQIRFDCVLPPAGTSKDDVRHDLGAAIVGGHLAHALREERGVTYGFDAGAHVLPGGTASLDIRSAVEASKLGVALAVLKRALSELSSQKVPVNDFAWAKLRLAGARGTYYMASSDLVAAVIETRRLGYPLERLDELASELDGVTADDVQRDFQACAAGNPTLSIVGDEEAVKAAFKQAWP